MLTHRANKNNNKGNSKLTKSNGVSRPHVSRDIAKSRLFGIAQSQHTIFCFLELVSKLC